MPRLTQEAVVSFWLWLKAAVQRYRRVLTIGIWGVVLLSLWRVSYIGLQELQAYTFRFRGDFLALSVLLLAVAFLTGAWGWHSVLAALGVERLAKQDMAGWLVSQAAKYLPAGMVWYLGGRFVQNRKEGIKSTTVLLALALEFSLYLWEAVIYFGVSLSAWPKLHWRYSVGLGALALNLVVSLFLPWFFKVLALFVERISPGHALVSALSDVQRNRVLWLPSFYFFQWALIGLAFGFMVASISPVDFADIFSLGGIFGFSSGAGYVIFLIPGGWGVRETALTLLLRDYDPVLPGAAISVLSRVWYTIVEVLAMLIGLLLSRISRPRKKSAANQS